MKSLSAIRNLKASVPDGTGVCNIRIYNDNITHRQCILAGAFLELMSEYSYKKLTPAYYEVAMKGKYLRDDDSSRMFDIIMDGAWYDFAIINSSVIGDPVFITRNSMQHKSGNFSSQYAASESVLKEKLAALLEIYTNS